MIRYTSEKQTTLPGFETPFDVELDLNNRWATLAQIIPWDDLALAYYSTFASHYGRPAKDARMVIGAVIIKHKLCLSDEEMLEKEPMQRVLKLNQLCAYKHEGFWKCMDNMRDKKDLEAMHKKGYHPWLD